MHAAIAADIMDNHKTTQLADSWGSECAQLYLDLPAVNTNNHDLPCTQYRADMHAWGPECSVHPLDITADKG